MLAAIGLFFATLWTSVAAYFALNAAAFVVRWGVPLVLGVVVMIGWLTGNPWMRVEMVLTAALVAIVGLEIAGKLPMFTVPPVTPTPSPAPKSPVK